jgi:hypothetical protein
MRLPAIVLGAGWLTFSLSPAKSQNITAATVEETQQLLRAAADPDISMAVWTTRSDTSAFYRRNPAVWTGSRIDLTGKAVWNSYTGPFGTTAISPRHVVYADHVNGLYPTGTIVRFVTNANSVVERKVVKSSRIGASDIDLSALDAALPDSIHWYKVMPEHWFLRCSRSAPGKAAGLPCLILDANTSSVTVRDLVAFFPSGFETGAPADPLRRSFTRNLRVGDSGSPMFLLIGHELVLDGICSTTATGAELSSSIALLNAAMRDAGEGVKVADLGAWSGPANLAANAPKGPR